MTHRKTKSMPKETELAASVRTDFLKVIPNGDGSKVEAQVFINDLDNLLELSGAQTFTFEIPEKIKDISPSEIEKLVRKEMKKRLSSVLKIAFGAALAESIETVFETEPKDTREFVLEMYREDFNRRNEVPKNKEPLPSMEKLISKIIPAWRSLIERKAIEIDEIPSLNKLAGEMGEGDKSLDVGSLSKQIKHFLPRLVVDGEPNYKHFLNLVRHKMKLQDYRCALELMRESEREKRKLTKEEMKFVTNHIPPENSKFY